MKTVWKFEIIEFEKIDDYFELDLPENAKILTLQMQSFTLCIWILVDSNVLTEKRKFRIYGTGHRINETDKQLSYIGTFQLHGGTFIYHLFEIL